MTTLNTLIHTLEDQQRAQLHTAACIGLLIQHSVDFNDNFTVPLHKKDTKSFLNIYLLIRDYPLLLYGAWSLKEMMMNYQQIRESIQKQLSHKVFWSGNEGDFGNEMDVVFDAKLYSMKMNESETMVLPDMVEKNTSKLQPGCSLAES